MTTFESVKCKCPPYKGSDFWNDPHRWCGVDSPSERFWMKDKAADCERTVRPVPSPQLPQPTFTLAQYQAAMLGNALMNSQLNYANQLGAYQSSTLSGLFGLGRLF